jgi:plastocyanin
VQGPPQVRCRSRGEAVTFEFSLLKEGPMKCEEIPPGLGIRKSRPFFRLVTLSAVLVLLTACGSGSGDSGATASAPPTASTSSGPGTASTGSTVEINNFMFTPKTLTVPAGATVTWKFDDSTQHTVTADDNSFTSQVLGSGQTYTHTFTSAGTVNYHCSIHTFMTGTIVVK